jgi:signal transduction histidine kinase
MSGFTWVVLVVVSTIAVFGADRLLWPDHAVMAFYALPILLASLRCSVRAVMGAVIGVNLVAIADLYLTGLTSKYVVADLVALLAISALAILYTLNRQELQRKIVRQQKVIDTVAGLRQPLAVILGYVRLLQSRPTSETVMARALDAIRRGAYHLRDMLDDVVTRWGES